jgi:hypothetical protein
VREKLTGTPARRLDSVSDDIRVEVMREAPAGLQILEGGRSA